MKLAISNIAWETPRMDEHLALLNEVGCHGFELSPSMIWQEPVDVKRETLLAFKQKINSYGLEIPSMHSLTYPRPDLTFFDSKESRDGLIRYIVALGEIANLLEISVMIFGSAKSRRFGDRDKEDCLNVMSAAFRMMAQKLAPLGVTLLIEPLGKHETDSINNLDEAYDLMARVDHPGFALHNDLKSSFTEGEDQAYVWSKYGKFTKHAHVANPGLKPPSSECTEHLLAAKAMHEAGYNRYISIEMGRNFGETLGVVKEALAFVRTTYL